MTPNAGAPATFRQLQADVERIKDYLRPEQAAAVLHALRLGLQQLHPADGGVVAKWREEIERAIQLQTELHAALTRAVWLKENAEKF